MFVSGDSRGFDAAGLQAVGFEIGARRDEAVLGASASALSCVVDGKGRCRG